MNPNGKIKHIDIETGNDKLLNIKSNQIIQPTLNENLKLLKKENIKIIFLENEKSKRILTSLTYLLSANSLTDPFLKFEKLWRAFNNLYTFIAKTKIDHNALVEFKKFMKRKPFLFDNSVKYFNQYKGNDIRLKLRIQELIRNNFPKGNQIEAYKDMILRYSDFKVMEIINETLVYKKSELESVGLYDVVINHINKHINLKTNNSIEIVSFISLIYMYFVRNKLFHGEIMDSTFRLLNGKEHEEMEWLCSILLRLNIDTINASNHF